jgi:hypothetical protein
MQIPCNLDFTSELRMSRHKIQTSRRKFFTLRLHRHQHHHHFKNQRLITLNHLIKVVEYRLSWRKTTWALLASCWQPHTWAMFSHAIHKLCEKLSLVWSTTKYRSKGPECTKSICGPSRTWKRSGVPGARTTVCSFWRRGIFRTTGGCYMYHPLWP